MTKGQVSTLKRKSLYQPHGLEQQNPLHKFLKPIVGEDEPPTYTFFKTFDGDSEQLVAQKVSKARRASTKKPFLLVFCQISELTTSKCSATILPSAPKA